MGWASNHADVLHWFPRHGKTMDDFRADVARQMEREEESDLTKEQVRKIARDELGKWLQEQDARRPTQAWQLEGLDRAMVAGITDGSRPMSLCTRLEAAMMAAKAKE